MTIKEAKQSVKHTIKRIRKNNPSFLTKLLIREAIINSLLIPADLLLLTDDFKSKLTSDLIILHGVACIIGLILSTGFPFHNDFFECLLSDKNDYDKNRLYVLKQLRIELNRGINRFESIDAKDFNEEVRKLEAEPKFVTRKKGPNTKYIGPWESYIKVNENGIITECNLCSFWMNQEELIKSHNFVGKHISELQDYLNSITSAAIGYHGESFDKVTRKYILRTKLLN